MKRLLFLTTIVILFAASAQAGLVAWYEFEGNADDSIGSNHGILMDGASIITDSQRGQVLSLDGDNDYMSLLECTVTTTEFTIAAWALMEGPGGGEKTLNIIFSQRDDNVGDNRCAISLLPENSISTQMAAAGIRSSDGTVQGIYTPRKTYGQWHHYAMTVNSDYFSFYIDGEIIDTVENLQLGDYVTSIDYITIGRARFNGRNTGFFNGFIDDSRFYDYALSQKEITELIPEPSTILMLGLGIPILAGFLRRKK